MKELLFLIFLRPLLAKGLNSLRCTIYSPKQTIGVDSLSVKENIWVFIMND